MVVYAFNTNTQEVEAGDSLSLWPACSTKWVLGQPRTAKVTQRNPASKQQQKPSKQKQNKTKEHRAKSENYKKK